MEYSSSVGSDIKVLSGESNVTYLFLNFWTHVLITMKEVESSRVHPVEVECKTLPPFVKYFQTGQSGALD